MPLTPDELASAVSEAVAAGAEDVHLHPKGPDGRDTLDPAVVDATMAAMRAAVPGIPIGVTTGAWAEPDPRRRAEAVHAWTVLPDHASVNWHEEGADMVAGALLVRGIGVEAGVFSGTDAVWRFRASPLAGRVLRVLAEVTDTDPRTATKTATRLLEDLSGTGPILLHGEEGSAWPVLKMAASRNLATRIGLEDTLCLPNGEEAPTNTALIRAAQAARS